MLTRLKVDGFKNLVGVDVQFGPFTCIAGANGVGKSNLFDAIRFLSKLANWSLLEAALSVRDDSGRNADVKGLFHRVGNSSVEKMSFEAEMIVPSPAIDDLGQEGKATTTFLRYTLEIGLRTSKPQAQPTNPLEILKEELVHILQSDAPKHLLFPHNAAQWRRKVVKGKRAGVAFISTAGIGNEPGTDTKARIIKLHQDGGGKGRAYERAATALPRTVLSSATAAESPTALCARREMQSWQLLQLEPAALRQPDEFTAPSQLESNGRHLAANLYRLATHDDSDKVCSQLANRLSELIGSVRRVRVDRDEKRELSTVMMTNPDQTELPARALSDGTLRFLALSVLELDTQTPSLICLEEPENGIHPDRIPAMLRLLQDLATDPEEPSDESNPLRQVIVNTHSPSVVMAVPDDSVLLARTEKALREGHPFTKAVFACLPNNWRNKDQARCQEVGKGEMLSYLNPTAVLRHEAPYHHRKRRIIDHPEFALFTPSGTQGAT
ncbi:MAG: ATPase [Verrucomicrobia bacterium]|nr:MAG: ATPase [Verrucomicrobiota bacterium]